MTNLLVATSVGIAFLLVGGPLAAALAILLFAPPLIGLLNMGSAE
jgi:hypothetical protein